MTRPIHIKETEEKTINSYILTVGGIRVNLIVRTVRRKIYGEMPPYTKPATTKRNLQGAFPHILSQWKIS